MNDLAILEAGLLNIPQVGCDVIHRFGPGLYIREVFIPAGTFAIGHRQKTRHMNIMLKGRVTIVNDDGTTTELVAPHMFVGEPGRKCGYIHEDMVWQNIYATTETDVETLEKMFLDKSDCWEEHNKVRLLQNNLDQKDFCVALEEFGLTEEIARTQSEDARDQIPFPFGGYKVAVSDSPIEGKGLFATANIKPGEIIAPARIEGKRTPAGRFTNHSQNPNAKMVMTGQNIDLVASRSIGGCLGGALGEEITIDYRQALSLSRERVCQQ